MSSVSVFNIMGGSDTDTSSSEQVVVTADPADCDTTTPTMVLKSISEGHIHIRGICDGPFKKSEVL